jgi:hypothetical protein
MGQITLNAWGKVATITYPDDMDTLAPIAFGESYGYEEMIEDHNLGDVIPNPQSLEEFTIQKIFDYVGEIMRAYSLKDAQAEAMVSATVAADAQMNSIAVEIEDSP